MLVRMLVRSPDDAWVPMCRVGTPNPDDVDLCSAWTAVAEARTVNVKRAMKTLLIGFMAESFCFEVDQAGGEIPPA